MMSDPSRRAVILGGARTPFAKLSGALATQSAVDLGVVAAQAAIARAGISPADVDNTIFGQVLQAGSGQNPARQVALRASIGIEIPAETINRVCGSGMRAITLAESLIRAGDFDVVLAGGMESMTNAPYLLRKARSGYRMGDGVLEDMMIGDGLQCAVACCHMGIHGGNVAAEEGIGREEQDAWHCAPISARSPRRTPDSSPARSPLSRSPPRASRPSSTTMRLPAGTRARKR